MSRASLWRRTLHWIAGRLPTRIIHAEAEVHGLPAGGMLPAGWAPLFERSHVWTGVVPGLGDVTVYLHHYLRSDPDRGLHDHPWTWAVSIPLAGGYVEERLRGIGGGVADIDRRRRRPFRPYRMTGHDFHRVVIPEGWPAGTSWSLFVTGRNGVKPWASCAWARAPSRRRPAASSRRFAGSRSATPRARTPHGG